MEDLDEIRAMLRGLQHELEYVSRSCSIPYLDDCIESIYQLRKMLRGYDGWTDGGRSRHRLYDEPYDDSPFAHGFPGSTHSPLITPVV